MCQKYFIKSASAFTNGEKTTDYIISKMLSSLSCLVFDRSSVMKKIKLYSQQANPNFRFPSEQIPLFSE
jgi:hypothetical protein